MSIGCTDSARAPVSLMTTPAASGALGPRLARGASGEPVLSWLEPDGDGFALRFSRLGNDGWQSPTTVARSDNWFVNRADFPSVIPITETWWLAHWLAKRPGGTYAYDVALSTSSDGGASWSEPFTPHSDGTATEHGFVSIYPSPAGAGVVWLDGRNTAVADSAASNDGHHAAGPAAMSLRAATVTPSGTTIEPRLVDDRVCDCCQTDVAVTSGGVVAVYRDRTPDEIRDIYVARTVDGEWQPGQAVARDGWEISGCPVNGPAVAAADNDVAVAWYTAADAVDRVRLARSSDGGRTFGPPIDIATGDVSGRVDVVLLESGAAIVSWLRRTPAGAGVLVVRHVPEGAAPGDGFDVSPIASRRTAGFPQMIEHGNTLVLAWTDETDGQSSIRSAQLDIQHLVHRSTAH